MRNSRISLYALLIVFSRWWATIHLARPAASRWRLDAVVHPTPAKDVLAKMRSLFFRAKPSNVT